MYNEHIKKFPYCFRAFLADISNLDIISADGEDMFPESYIGGYLSWFLEKNKFDIIESQLKEALSIIGELKTSNETCFKLTYLAFGYLKSLGWDGFEMDSEEFMSCENIADALFKSTETKQSTDQRIEKLKKELLP